MTTRRQAYMRTLLASSVLLWAAGCGEDSKAEAGAGTGNNSSDDNNGGNGTDSDDAAAPSDAGPDGSMASGDGGTDEMGAECEVLGDILSFEAARASGRVFSAAISGNTTHLAYLVATCSGTPTKNNAQGLEYVSFETQGDATAPAKIVNTLDCYVTRDPALVAHDGAIDLFYTSNSAGSYELFAQDLKAGAAAVRQTTDMDNEFGITATVFDPAQPPMAAYINDSTLAGPSMAAATVTKQIGKVESEVLAIGEGHHATQLAISRAALDSSPAWGAVAWVSDRTESKGAYLRLIDEIGKGKGDVVELGKMTGPSSSVAIAAGPLGAGVVYTLAPDGFSHELRFRAIAKDGAVGNEARLTSGNQNVRDISIARYAKGYVVAYRQVSAGMPSMRLMFVDEMGNVAGTRQVAEATVGGAGSQVMVANDGRIVLVWNDVETVTTGDVDAGMGSAETFVRVHAARLECQ